MLKRSPIKHIGLRVALNSSIPFWQSIVRYRLFVALSAFALVNILFVHSLKILYFRMLASIIPALALAAVASAHCALFVDGMYCKGGPNGTNPNANDPVNPLYQMDLVSSRSNPRSR